MHASSPSRRLSESPSHTFLETVSPGCRYHLVLSENNVRINAQLQSVASLAVLGEAKLFGGSWSRCRGVLTSWDILPGHKMNPSGKRSREIPHFEFRAFGGRGSWIVLQWVVGLPGGER